MIPVTFSSCFSSCQMHAKIGQSQRDCQKTAQPRAALRLFWIAPGVKSASSQPQDWGCTHSVGQATLSPLCGKLTGTQGHLRANSREPVWIHSAVAGSKARSFIPPLSRRKDRPHSVSLPPKANPEGTPFFPCYLHPNLPYRELTTCLQIHSPYQHRTSTSREKQCIFKQAYIVEGCILCCPGLGSL